MAKAKTQPIEDVELEDVEDEVEETETAMTPKALAEELEINAKTLRGYLRKEFPRAAGEKNTSWKLTDAQVEAARIKFSETPEDEDDEDETEDEA